MEPNHNHGMLRVAAATGTGTGTGTRLPGPYHVLSRVLSPGPPLRWGAISSACSSGLFWSFFTRREASWPAGHLHLAVCSLHTRGNPSVPLVLYPDRA
jgi:hypothetical protein